MKLFQKIKEALFEEEEYTEQIKITPEMRNEATPTKETKVEDHSKKEVVKEKPVVDHTEVKSVPKAPESTVSERELFNTQPNSPFFDFDEMEFEKHNNIEQSRQNSVDRVRQSNVLEFERKKKTERHIDYGRYERVETVETTERKKFKPSPIISPVYGILDKDYVKTDIMQRSTADKVDIQSVRNKAFGEKREEASPVTTYYEQTETVTISEPEEKQKKVKTIDELLENTSDVSVDIDGDFEAVESFEDVKDVMPEPVKEERKPQVEDTLENDLFDLIDSMYSNKEDGE